MTGFSSLKVFAEMAPTNKMARDNVRSAFVLRIVSGVFVYVWVYVVSDEDALMYGKQSFEGYCGLDLIMLCSMQCYSRAWWFSGSFSPPWSSAFSVS